MLAVGTTVILQRKRTSGCNRKAAVESESNIHMHQLKASSTVHVSNRDSTHGRHTNACVFVKRDAGTCNLAPHKSNLHIYYKNQAAIGKLHWNRISAQGFRSGACAQP